MRSNIKRITNTLKCSESHALNVEKYMDEGDMIDWSEASVQLINTIARAVNDKLLRDAPVRIIASDMPSPHTDIVTNDDGKQVEVGAVPPPASSNAPKSGTKIAHALLIYKEMEVDGVRSSRQDIISAMANSMQIEKKAAAGYYQNCKKKMGE